MSEQMDKFVELCKTKKEVSAELRAINKELRAIRPDVQKYMEASGETTLKIGDSKVVLTNPLKKKRKSKKEYEDEMLGYLEELGVANPESVLEEMVNIKSGTQEICPEVRVL